MTAPPVRSRTTDLAYFVDAYEEAVLADPAADLADYLPPRDHPLYLPVLAELARIDLERAWRGDHSRGVARLADRFPDLRAAPELFAAVAFEEYRQRRLAGDAVPPSEYADRFGVDVAAWPEIGPGSARPKSSPSTKNPSGTFIQSDPAEPPPTVVAAVSGPATEEPGGPPTGQAAPESLVREWSQSDPTSAENWLKARKQLPDPGTQFLGFRLEEELGRGAMGRVYLARQGELSGRPVALKVACNIAGESRTLAQLQHTNIVPIYSFHQVNGLQAVCMPYFGRTTLAHVVKHIAALPALPASGRELRAVVGAGRETDEWERVEGLSYADAALWVGGQLADGLAHAHARGILHRDLKPANVLLSDEGRPMLLDFNLAEDTKERGSAAVAAIGGTLPYMAPEQMEAFGAGRGRLDERADVYALGVILFELLTGKHPFPHRTGQLRDLVPLMLADRRQPPPDPRSVNPAVSPAAAAIVRKCLAADPAGRYQRADDLRDDITRHLNHLPLKHAPNPSVRERVRKWAKRHPRLASSATVAAVALVAVIGLAGGLVYVREQNRSHEARAAFADHRAAFADAQAFLDDRRTAGTAGDEAVGKLTAILGRYGAPADGEPGDGWASGRLVRYLAPDDRARLREDVGETYYLLAKVAYSRAAAADGPDRDRHLDAAERWNAAADRLGGDRMPRAVREQRADLVTLRKKTAEADQLRAEARGQAPKSPRDHYLLGYWLAQQGRHRDALPHLRAATQADPENFSAWFVRGTTHLALEQNELAALCFGSCTALRKDSAPAWLNRGLAYAKLRFYDQACDDYDRALELKPDFPEAYVNRSAARAAQDDFRGAEADLTRALEAGNAPVRVYFLRARVRERLGDATGAKADRAAGLALTPADEMSWIARAEARKDADPQAALADVEQALKLNPISMLGLQLKAHILDQKLRRDTDALAVLSTAVEHYPDYAPARAARGIQYARAGKWDLARRDARDALLLDTKAPNLYQVAGIYALTSRDNPDDRAEALRLLWAALKTGFGLGYVDGDTDLDPIRKDPEFVRLVAAARTLHGKGPR